MNAKPDRRQSIHLKTSMPNRGAVGEQDSKTARPTSERKRKGMTKENRSCQDIGGPKPFVDEESVNEDRSTSYCMEGVI